MKKTINNTVATTTKTQFNITDPSYDNSTINTLTLHFMEDHPDAIQTRIFTDSQNANVLTIPNYFNEFPMVIDLFCNYFNDQYQLYCAIFSEEVVAQCIQKFSVDEFLREVDWEPGMVSHEEFRTDRAFVLINPKLHTFTKTEHRGSYSREVNVNGYTVITRYQYSSLALNKLTEMCLFRRWPWLKAFKISAYNLETYSPCEFYLSTEFQTLYVPLKAMVDNNFGLVEERMKEVVADKETRETILATTEAIKLREFMDMVAYGEIPSVTPIKKEEAKAPKKETWFYLYENDRVVSSGTTHGNHFTNSFSVKVALEKAVRARFIECCHVVPKDYMKKVSQVKNDSERKTCYELVLEDTFGTGETKTFSYVILETEI